MSAASSYFTAKAIAEAERANGTATVTLDVRPGVLAEPVKQPAKPIGRNRPGPLPALTEDEQRKQIADGLQAAGLSADTQLTPEQERRALAWPKGLRNGALTTYIMEGKNMATQTKEAETAKAATVKVEAAKANGNGNTPAKTAAAKSAQPKGKWYEVNQPDVPMYEDEQKKAKVTNGFAAYLVGPDGHPGTFIGVFDGSGSRPAQAVRLAISKLDGYDQAKAEQAEFITCRVRNLRKTLPIAAPSDGK